MQENIVSTYESTAKTLSDKYSDFFEKYIEIYSRYVSEGKNYPMPNDLCFILSTLKFIEQYIETVQKKNIDEQKLSSLKFMKDFEDLLFQPKPNEQVITSPKIEIVS